MARIRTIKPEFFTSEDIVGLSALARLLYIALWCEADREGRLVWKPKTFKLRYLPADACDTEVLCQEIVTAGLVVLYGDGLAYIPKFGTHQHLNPREASSQLPVPHACSTRAPRVTDTSSRDSDAQGGREGKGRERKEETREDNPRDASPSGSRLPADWSLPDDWRTWAIAERPDVEATREALIFADYWHGKAGKDARKADWLATWKNWIRRAHGMAASTPRNGAGAERKRVDL
jgi:hypothetical protein